MTQDYTEIARGAAAHAALKVVEAHGEAIGAEILRGYAEAFIIAHAAVTGWAATIQLTDRLTVPNRVIERGVVPHLVFSKEETAA